ncbi:TK protein kinase, partial [Sphaeroforma arctica JP610]
MGYYQNDLYFGNNSVYEYLWLTEIFFNVEFEDTAYEFWIPNAKWKGIKNLCAPTDKTADYRLWSNPNIDKVHDELGGEFGVSYEQCPFGPPAHRTIDSGKVHLGGPVESLLDNNNTLTLQCRKKPCEVNMCKNGGKCKTDFYAEYKATCECVEPYYGLDCSLTTGLPVTARETFYYSQRDCKKYIFSGSLHITGPNQFMPMLDNGTTFNQFKTYSYTTGLFTNNFGYGDGGRTDFFYPGEELYLRVTSDEQVGFRFLSAGDTTKIRNITTCTDTQHPSFVLWHSGTSSQLLQTRTTGMGNTVHEDCLGTYLTKTQFIGGLMRDLTDDQGELIIQCFNTTNEVAYGVSSPSQGGTASKSDVANAGLIASVVLGVVFIIALVTAVLYYLHRWRKKRSEASRRRSDDPARASREHPLCGLPNNFLAKINHPDSIRVRQQMRCKVIPADRVTKMHELGRGNFGTVYCGLLLGDKSGEESPVAIKELNNSSTGENSEDACQFLVEAQIMRDMNHVNVMCCIGLIEGPPLGIVLDIMTMGDLNTYLGSQDERETSVTVAEKYFFCYQIARGMNYLGRMGIVHRDLATRNCMLGLPSKQTTFGFPELKVADFGLSRVVSDQGYYRMENRTKLPFAWMSPEALTERTFNGKSDVWSFGITVWEIFNNCNGTPYGRDKNVFAILTFLNSGLRLEKPECCTK